MIFYAELKTYNLFNHLFSYDDEDYFLKKRSTPILICQCLRGTLYFLKMLITREYNFS